jgi:ABC-type sugar transport system ATPase subunit
MIAIENLCIHQGRFRLENVSLEIPTGAYGVLMGRTASGKTTILEAVCGLRPMVAGRIRLPAGDVTHRRPAERGVGYVPQEGVLFPSMSVEEHLAFALRVRRWPADRVRRRVAELAAMLGIEPLLARRPQGLSGGERQRVALGRALSFRPDVLCLDEPLSALDEQTREQMYGLLAEVRRQRSVTVLHVTHSSKEAERLADTLLSLRDGKITPGLLNGQNED